MGPNLISHDISLRYVSIRGPFDGASAVVALLLTFTHGLIAFSFSIFDRSDFGDGPVSPISLLCDGSARGRLGLG